MVRKRLVTHEWFTQSKGVYVWVEHLSGGTIEIGSWSEAFCGYLKKSKVIVAAQPEGQREAGWAERMQNQTVIMQWSCQAFCFIPGKIGNHRQV